MTYTHIVLAVSKWQVRNGNKPINAEDLIEILKDAESREVHESESGYAKFRAFWNERIDEDVD